MKIVICCGASGGHIFPALALADELKKRHNCKILIICSRKVLDVEILQKTDLDFIPIPSGSSRLILKPILPFLLTIKFITGFIVSLKVLVKFEPDCVVGFGGFVSVPVILAAKILRIPIIIHEQNVIAGLANRITSFFANRIAFAFDNTRGFTNYSKVVKTGTPIRKNLLAMDRACSRERLGLDEDKFTIFIVGGSQGASFINNVMPEVFKLMSCNQREKFQLIHITGRRDCGFVEKRYREIGIKAVVFSFLDEIGVAYTASDLVITRAGATTIAELVYFGKPSILIPYPKRSVHQLENALFVSKNKAGIAIQQDEFYPEDVKDLILSLLATPKRLEEMSSHLSHLDIQDMDGRLAKEVMLFAPCFSSHCKKEVLMGKSEN